ncbi:hypothetical protein P4N68_08380 [Corynebacterium felinum]|uniref:Uncharacterized protein n=1 Tax=Corynebacterium felinum TaxID=131318 RepID=A0ABU2B8M8_9CORY|nr:hypothetical protein [Corynebacterium felinum]MDF5821095.1 hypothetical protein [Corynebacterium felinum]MDR7354961.1 hypothetical protein [Corynebacterium felinum]
MRPSLFDVAEVSAEGSEVSVELVVEMGELVVLSDVEVADVDGGVLVGVGATLTRELEGAG